jgi:hypothetical protein
MMMPYGVGQVFLWVRDPTKGIATPGLPHNPDPNGGAFCSISPFATTLGGYTQAQYQTALTEGGEQLLVTVKGISGGTGVNPVFWPTAINPNPYYNALLASNSSVE